jgi:hypothetical protein
MEEMLQKKIWSCDSSTDPDAGKISEVVRNDYLLYVQKIITEELSMKSQILSQGWIKILTLVLVMTLEISSFLKKFMSGTVRSIITTPHHKSKPESNRGLIFLIIVTKVKECSLILKLTASIY